MTEQSALIGVKYPDTYAVEETFQLFKIPWEWYDPDHEYDVIIARREEIRDTDTPLIDLSEKDYFAGIARILNEGLPHCHEPVVDILIDELREELKKHTLLVEIPPVPWGYSYMVALTHDVDITSVRERRWISVGYAIYQCIMKGKINDAFRIFLSKFGIGKDPWNCFNDWIKYEDDLGVRSTFFFVPYKNKAGIDAPDIRATCYDLDPELIKRLVEGGWEVGVHGIDNWKDTELGRLELQRILDAGGNSKGNRTHWLIFDENSWERLDSAGYSYDSTCGYNEDIGFRAGTLQVYRPRGCASLLELPLHIEDMALFSKFCWEKINDDWIKTPCLNLNANNALQEFMNLTEHADKYGGVVTLLWHHEKFVPDYKSFKVYNVMLEKFVNSKIWVTNAIDIVIVMN